MRLLHLREHAEARYYASWCAMVLWSVKVWAACGLTGLLLLAADAPPVVTLCPLVLAAGDFVITLVHTIKVRAIVGVWPWNVGR